MTLAPVAPGALGERLDPAATETYLADLDTWVRERKAQLDEVDAVALDSAASESLTGDLLLSMALWKAASDRLRLLLATWDGGRVGPTERERLSVLIWGRLDATVDPALLERAGGSSAGSALALSLPEACRLSDALLQQLRGRLALDPAADANARRRRDRFRPPRRRPGRRRRRAGRAGSCDSRAPWCRSHGRDSLRRPPGPDASGRP